MASHHGLSGHKALVTGATGFIGSHLCKKLYENGANVHAVSRARHASDRIHWWQSDLQDIESVRRCLNQIRPEFIFHLSGHVTAAPDINLVLSTFDSHLVSTVYLLTAATEIGCRRMVLTGSLTEPPVNSPSVAPSSPYAAAKWAANAYARMFHVLYQTPVTVVRPFMTYGPMQDQQKIIPHVIVSLLRGESPKLASGQWRADWVYIDDVVDGLLAAAQMPNVEGCTIDLGSGIMIPVQQVVERIVRLVGTAIAPSFGVLQDRPREEIKVADTAYAQTKLGWVAQTSLDDGLARTVAWYREQFTAGLLVGQQEDLR
jgi:UDP-glucose 4-epimerase